MMLTTTEAQDFIEKIKSGEIQREILTNFADDFSGEGEREALKLYEAYLRSLYYEIARRIN